MGNEFSGVNAPLGSINVSLNPYRPSNYRHNRASSIDNKSLSDESIDLEDFLEQLKQIKKLGPLENIIKMLPGAKKMGLNNVEIDPKRMSHIEAIILSMTPEERHNPDILKASRKQRIAKGSGTTVQDINKFIKSFEMTQSMMKKMKNQKGGMNKMLKGMNMNDLKGMMK